MSKYIPPTITEEVYTFSDLVMIGKKWRGCTRTTWNVICQTCNDRLLVQRIGPKHWVARCHKCKVEYTITPSEYYILKHADFKKIMGDL